MADFQWYWFWFELARSWNWRVLSYRKSTLLIHWLFYYNLMFVLACCFFSSNRADGMSNDSSANVLVSSIHNSMYYLGYVQFFYWLFLSFVSIAKATTIWRRADAIMGYKCFSIPSFQVNDWPVLAGVLYDHLGYEWSTSVSAVFIIRGIWSTLRDLIL